MKPPVFFFSLAILLVSVMSSSGAYVLRLGEFDVQNHEFEQESSIENNAQYYAYAGDYRGVTGRTGTGRDVADPEPLKSAGTIDGMRRALTSSFPVMEIFFMMNPEDLSKDYLIFSTSFISPGGGSSHHLKISLNGQEIWKRDNVTAATGQFDVVLRPSEFSYAEGANYLTFERTGGGSSSAWISLDAVHLQAVPEPQKAFLMILGLSAICLIRKRK